MEEKMPLDQVHAFLAWMNQHEPLVEPSPVNVEVWHKAIHRFDPALLKGVVLDYWSRADSKPTPAVVKRLAQSEIERRAARRSALTAAPSPPVRDMWEDPTWDREEFQRARMRARVEYCRRHGIDHDGDGWTASDRPKTALGGRVTAFDWQAETGHPAGCPFS